MNDDPMRRTVALIFTAWMLVWVPIIIWAYGLPNFLWLCNLAQFLLLYALWRGDTLVASSQAGIVTLVGLFWTGDFIVGLASGGRLTVFATYMFNPEIPLLARASSLYHIGLPILAIWLVRRIGYDRRGPWLQTGIAALALPSTWALTDPERNINWIFSPFGIEQIWLPEAAYVGLLLVLYPVLIFWPGHALVLGILRILPRHSD